MALNPKQKKRLKIGIIIASIVTLLIATPVVAFYAVFFDSRAKNVVAEKDLTTQAVLCDNISVGLNNVKDTQQFDFSCSKEKINELFKLLKTRSYEFNRYITNFEYDFDNSCFYFDIQVPLFKTRLIADVDSDIDDEKNALVFKINDLKMGRAKSLLPLGKKLTSNEIIIKALLWTFETMALNVSFDKETTSFVFPLKNLVFSLYSLAMDDPNSLFSALAAQIASDKNATFYGDSIGFKADLSNYVSKNKYEIPEYGTSWPIEETLNNFIVPMIKDGLLTEKYLFKNFIEPVTNSHAFDEDYLERNKVVRYVMCGYENMSSEDKKLIEKIDFKKYGIDNIKEYQGICFESFKDKMDLSNHITNLINEEIDKNVDRFASDYSFSLVLTENDFKNALLASPLLFDGACPSSINGDNVHYALIDGSYINLLDNSFAIVNHFNVDGNKTTFSNVFSKPTKFDNAFVFEMDESLFGDSEICFETDLALANLYNNCFSKFGDWIYFNINVLDRMRLTTKDDYKLTLSFDKAIHDSKLPDTLAELGLSYETKLNINNDEMTLSFELRG